MDNLSTLPPKTGHEKITGTTSTVLNYWQWAYSDLKQPTVRGDFAEYLVYLALRPGLSNQHYQTRMEWDVVDFVYSEGIRTAEKKVYFCDCTKYGWGIEVKSTSGSNKNQPKFKTSEKEGYHPSTNKIVKHKRRWSELYIFSYLDDDSNESKDILNMENWSFFVVATHEIDFNHISPKQLESRGYKSVKHSQLKQAVDDVVNQQYEKLKHFKEQHDSIKMAVLITEFT